MTTRYRSLQLLRKVAQMPKKLPSRAITIAMLLSAFMPAASPSYGEEPSLSETLAWMDSTYNPHSDMGGALGHGREEMFSSGRPFKRRTSTFTYNYCQMSLHTQDDPTAPLYSDLYTSAVYNFNLRDIDPKSIKLYLYDPQLGGLSCDFNLGNMVCSVAEMEFETPNQAGLIDEDFHIVWTKLTGSEHEARVSKKHSWPSSISMMQNMKTDLSKHFGTRSPSVAGNHHRFNFYPAKNGRSTKRG